DMFYYFIPRCAVAGTVTLEGRAQTIVDGQGWYDHEFGGPGEQNKELGPDGKPKEPEKTDIAWNWAAVQLDDGCDISAYSLVRVADGKILHQWAIVSQPDGEFRSYKDMTLAPLNKWRSTRTFYDYPTRWKLSVPAAKIELSIDAAFDDQEFITT